MKKAIIFASIFSSLMALSHGAVAMGYQESIEHCEKVSSEEVKKFALKGVILESDEILKIFAVCMEDLGHPDEDARCSANDDWCYP